MTENLGCFYVTFIVDYLVVVPYYCIPMKKTKSRHDLEMEAMDKKIKAELHQLVIDEQHLCVMAHKNKDVVMKAGGPVADKTVASRIARMVQQMGVRRDNDNVQQFAQVDKCWCMYDKKTRHWKIHVDVTVFPNASKRT